MKTIGKILLVDDEKELAEELQIQLEQIPYEVFTSFSGKEALSVLEKEQIDVMVVDVRMPEIDGIETIRRGLKIQPDIQCILMTGHANDIETAVEAMKLGAINFLSKPNQVAPKILDASIKEGLKKLELIRAVRKEQDRLKKANSELKILKDKLEELLKERTAQLKTAKLKELSVSIMELSVQYYELAMKKNKVDLAIDSGIWNVYSGENGLVPKTMNRYLKIDTFPQKRPKYREIIKTGHFALSRPAQESYSNIRKRLKKRLKALEDISVRK